jgi:hypothetical protein
VTVSRQQISTEVESYLDELRRHLRGLPQSEVEDIIGELKSHISDILGRALEDAGATADVLDRLGPPRDLASRYRASRAMSRAGLSATPPRVLAAALAWARASLQGASVLAMALAGYFLSASLLAAAALKPFFPARTGLWRSPDGESYSLRLGLGTTQPTGEEILGWLMVPVGLTLGGLLLWVVTQHARSALQKAKLRITSVHLWERQFH